MSIINLQMKDIHWQSINTFIEKEFQNETLTIDRISQEVGLSRMHLHRIIKEKTGLSTSHYIRQFRLEKALEWLKINEKTISEIAFAVGFKDPNYFTRCFVEVYGITPSDYC